MRGDEDYLGTMGRIGKEGHQAIVLRETRLSVAERNQQRRLTKCGLRMKRKTKEYIFLETSKRGF